MDRKFWGAAALVAAMAASPAQAIPITFDFTGTISSHTFFDPWSFEFTEDPTVIGQAFTARMTIETDQFGSPILTEECCDVRTLNSPLVGQTPAPALDFTIGGAPFAVPTYDQTYNYYYLIDGPPPPVSADQIIVGWRSNPSPRVGIVNVSSLDLTSMNSVDAGFVDLDQPFDPASLLSYDLSDFTLNLTLATYDCPVANSCRQLLVENYALAVGSVARTIGGGEVSVPEPGTLALLAAGLLGAGLARRRRLPTPTEQQPVPIRNVSPCAFAFLRT
jgi:hypothetical protein